MATKANLEGGTISDAIWRQGFKCAVASYSGSGSGVAATLGLKTPPIVNIDPNGGASTVTFPAEAAASKGLFFFITNTADAAEGLTFKKSDAATNWSPSVDIGQNESAIVWCDGAAWKGGVLKNT